LLIVVADVFNPKPVRNGETIFTPEVPNLDKDISSAIKRALDTSPELKDECGGWHVICGKSFASSLTYHTKHVIFFDFLEQNKSYLMFKT
jgi:hypothetical protein